MAPRRKFRVSWKLEVLNYAEATSGEAAARHYNIDAKQIRVWKKQRAELEALAEGTRARLQGGGRRRISEDMEATLRGWILDRRAKYLRVSRKMIQAKAMAIFPEMSDVKSDAFHASRGWLERFMKRNKFTLRKRTSLAQKDAQHFMKKLVNFVTFTSRKIAEKNVKACDIIAMDETACWFDMPGDSTVDTVGARSITLKTTA